MISLACIDGREAIDEGLILGPGPAADEPVAEELAGDGGFAGAGRPDDEADLPGLVAEVEVDDPLAFRLLGGREIENALDLDDARRAGDPALAGDEPLAGLQLERLGLLLLLRDLGDGERPRD